MGRRVAVRAGQRGLVGRQTWYWDRADREPSWAAHGATPAGIVLGLLAAEWPRVREWTLPQADLLPDLVS